MVGHGSWVLRTIAEFAPDATYHFYRIETNELALQRGSNTIPEGRLIDAFDAADSDDLDLLNVSGGVYHHRCDRECEIATFLAEDVEGDHLTVAAAGNRNAKSELKHVLCPALREQTLAVSGYVPRCTHDYVDDRSSDQIWADLTSVPKVEKVGAQQKVCGFGQCAPGHSCGTARSETWFPLCALPAGGKPDLLAPVYYPHVTEKWSYLMPGTSYATPVVTGLLAAILGDVDRAFDAAELLEAVRDTARTPDDLDEPNFSTAQAKFDVAATREQLAGSQPSR